MNNEINTIREATKSMKIFQIAWQILKIEEQRDHLIKQYEYLSKKKWKENINEQTP